MKRTDWIKRASGLFVPPMLRWSPGYPCCCGGGNVVICEACGETAPSSWLVSITSVTDKTCDECESFNGDWILDQFTLNASSHCIWYTELDPPICDNIYLGLHVYKIETDMVYAVRTFKDEFALPYTTHSLLFYKFSGPADCSSLEDYSLNTSLTAIENAGLECSRPSPCLITANPA